MGRHFLDAILASLLGGALVACEVEESERELTTLEQNEQSAERLPSETTAAETRVGNPALSSPESGATLTAAESPDYGAHLADSEGRALYVLEADEQAEGVACTAECASVWPPFVAPEMRPEAADANLDAELIGIIERDDGTLQVTYNGHPLYYYANDFGTGRITGQDVEDQWGEWYLISPSGEKVEQEAATS